MKREEEAKEFQQTIASLQNKLQEVENHSTSILKQNQQYQKDVKVLEESLLQSTMNIGSPGSSANHTSTLPMQRQVSFSRQSYQLHKRVSNKFRFIHFSRVAPQATAGFPASAEILSLI